MKEIIIVKTPTYKKRVAKRSGSALQVRPTLFR